MGAAIDQPVILRAAQAGDSAALQSMVLALAAEIGEEKRVESQPEDFLRLGFSEPACFQALLAEQGGHAVGMCLYFFSFSSWMGSRGVYVQDLYVAPGQRGTGLGRKLMAETARIAGQQGARYLRLSVDRSNVSAQSFYKSLGMKYSDNELVFKAIGDDFKTLMLLD